MWKKALRAAALLLAVSTLILWGAGAVLRAAMPEYADNLGNDNHNEKLYGLELLKASAQREDNIIIYGSSELRTFDISTHPVNFFADKRDGFQVNIIGRGSCQSIIHALSVAASGDALSGKKVVLITSPQSYVKEGITPDMFLANFSKQHFLTIMGDRAVSESVKARLSLRTEELLEEYKAEFGSYGGYEDVLLYTRLYNSGNFAAKAALTLLKPGYALQNYLLGLRDLADAAALIRSEGDTDGNASGSKGVIDWAAEQVAATNAAKPMTDNNDFGMLKDYYNRYIGSKLKLQEGKEKNLSYSVSEEYDDLRLLLDVCKEKELEIMFVHVPLHGQWSDYTQFSADRRNEYYENVREIVGEYNNVTLCDLTVGEYEPYFLCDVMHLGWNGWLKFDEALSNFYHGDLQ
jgi:D-alanine transfer protein